ncbi:MAG: CvpA family protein [Patescibacteria group bacterium]|nr:CvpA family protein [Patescibacteria group bacterium]MDD5164763.1 CvpA family protein [Patescibacteria group bacterium]MDD5534421.1 CvpA family protein [Patescibacteria group bacterium]
MTFFDLVLLLVLFGFIWFNFWQGLVTSLGGIISLILGVTFATRWYDIIASNFLVSIIHNQNISRLIAFILIFIIARFIVILIFKIINKIFDLLSLIPFLQPINHLGGGIFGLIEGGLSIGLVLDFLSKFPWGNWLAKLLASSNIAPILVKFSHILSPLLPEVFKQIKSLI